MNGKQSERHDQWRSRIAEQEKSGQSIRRFCRDTGISEFSFYTWRKRLSQERPVSFALVETTPTAERAVLEFVLCSGDRLRLPADPATLRTVLTVLRERP